MGKRMNIDEQIAAISKQDSAHRTVFIEVENNKIPVRFKKGTKDARALIVNFHGAVDRKTREVPAFVPWFPNIDAYAHQLSVSDPSIMNYDGLSIAWYAGSEAFPLQSKLTAIIDSFTNALEVNKTILFGTSGGGFAALYNTWHSKHSHTMAIVGNPQTDISNYYEKHIDNYLKACWSSLSTPQELFQNIDQDITSLFSQRFSRTVVYVQSTADEFHLVNHMTPFLEKSAPHKAARLILDTGFWGRFGHSPSFDAYLPWIKACLLSPTTKKKDVLTAKSALDASTLNPAPNAVAQRANRDGFKVGDMKIADSVSNWLLDR